MVELFTHIYLFIGIAPIVSKLSDAATAHSRPGFVSETIPNRMRWLEITVTKYQFFFCNRECSP